MSTPGMPEKPAAECGKMLGATLAEIAARFRRDIDSRRSAITDPKIRADRGQAAAAPLFDRGNCAAPIPGTRASASAAGKVSSTLMPFGSIMNTWYKA